MPIATKKRVIAEEICITDANGRVRASLSFEPHGFPLLQLNDAAGRPRLELSLDPDGDPHLSMWSDKNECVLGIGFSSRERESGMTLWAGGGGAILTIGVDQEGTYERLQQTVIHEQVELQAFIEDKAFVLDFNGLLLDDVHTA